MSSTSGSHWWYLFHKEVKSWDSSSWFTIWRFQTPAQKRYLQTHLLAERFVFFFFIVGDDRGFPKEGVKTYLTAVPISLPKSPTFFSVFTSVFYMVSSIGRTFRLRSNTSIETIEQGRLQWRETTNNDLCCRLFRTSVLFISRVRWSASDINSACVYKWRTIDYRCDNRRFWLSTHNCQVPTTRT